MRPVAERLARLRVAATLVVACLLVGGCAASSATRHGRDAERLQDYDLAVVEYTKALKLRPNDVGVRLGLDRAKLRASEEHFQRGRRLAATGKLEESLMEYELAAELNPTNGAVDAGAPVDPVAVAHQDRGFARREDPAASAGRADAGPSPAGPRPPVGRQDADDGDVS